MRGCKDGVAGGSREIGGYECGKKKRGLIRRS